MKPNSALRIAHRAGRERGMTLVELMIAMVLGLIFIGGAVSLTMANRRSYNTNEGLTQVQEGARTAFEMLARDMRQAGITGCDNTGRIGNVLDTGAGTAWWQVWFGIRGYDGAQVSTAAPFGAGRGERVAGTDSVQWQGLQGLGMSVESHDPVAAYLQINAADTDIAAGDVMIACDFDHAAIFQVTAYDAVNVALTHDIGAGTPGNCSTGLGFPTVCTATGTAYQFRRNALLGSFAAAEWFVGNSGRATDSGRSLFRQRLGAGGVEVVEEVVTDVTDLQIEYRVADADEFATADTLATADWANVNAARIVLTLNSADAQASTDPGVNNGRLQRSYSQIIALRNRVP